MGHQPSLGAALGASPPKPLTPPTSWPSLELEVLDKMPVAIFSASRNPEDWSKGSLREANFIAQNLGRQLPKSFLDVTDDHGLMTFKGRLLTFPADWAGCSPLEMAWCGLYISRDGNVRCIVCGIKFRNLNTGDRCHLQVHKTLAPRCLQLLRCECHGPTPPPEGKRLRRNSTSTICDLGCDHA